MWKIAEICLISVIFIQSSHAYSMGAPDQACKKMQPGHGFDPQNTEPDPADAPVKLTLNPSPGSSISPGQKVQVALDVASPDGSFRGFIVQARDASDKETQIGNFEIEEDTSSHMTCGKGIHNSITHRNSEDKKAVKATWTAPSDFEGEVYFRYSFVEDYTKYYVGLETPVLRVTRSSETGSADNAGGSDEITPSEEVIDNTSDDSSVIFPGQESTRTSTTRTTTASTTSTTTTTTTTTVPPAPSGVDSHHSIFLGCGNSKACFGIPLGCMENGGCKVVVSYELSRDEMLFKMVGQTDGYIAVGLSPNNDKMGDDLTTSCYYNSGNGQVGVQTGYNVGYWNQPLRPPKFGITNFKGSYTDGFINCEFTRPSEIAIDDNSVPANINMFRLLKDKYVILLAEGPFRDGRIAKHTIKDSSSEPLALGIATNLQARSKLFLKLHGAFMIGAWIGAASLGIMVARYFKQTWTGATCCKKDMWFVVHRMFMVLTWMLTIAGFLLIFVELGWQWTAIPIEENPHPVLGCVTTGLCFIQPFMALMRPHPGASTRPLFNWLHWLVGNGAHIVGIVAIFFAVDLDKAELPRETDYLLIAFVIFHALTHLIMSCVMCTSDKRAKHASNKNGYQMRAMGGYPPTRGMYPDYEELKRDAPGSGLRKFFLAVYIIVGALVTAGLIALVVLAPTRQALFEAGILPEN